MIDDTPNAVVLSGFDPVRRRLPRGDDAVILDGRIHPTRIEKWWRRSPEMDETITRLGEEAVLKAGLRRCTRRLSNCWGDCTSATVIRRTSWTIPWKSRS